MLVRVSPEQEKQFLSVVPSGRFKVAPLLKVIPPTVIIVCLYCYYMAVSHGQVKPFPYCTVTNTATPYPQDIVFRTIMTPCTVFFLLMWLTCYFVLQQLNAQNKLKPIPQRIWWHGWFGSICFGITMATIDSGKMAGGLHSVCAVIFFILYTLNLRLVNKAYTDLKAIQPNVISDKSLQYKSYVTKVIYAVIIYELLRLIIPGAFEGTAKEICIIEWVVVFGFCFYFYSFSWDWKDYYFVLFVGQCSSMNRIQNQLILNQQQEEITVIGQPILEQSQKNIEMGGVVLGQIVYPQFNVSYQQI